MLELVALALVMAAFFGIGRWIVLPIDLVAQRHKAPVRFSISDFLCLFLAVQIPLAAIYVLIHRSELTLYWVFTAASWFVGPLVWFGCAQALSRAGISRGVHRWIFLCGVLPVVYYGLVAFVVLPFAGLVAYREQDASALLTLQRWVGFWFLLGGLLIVSGGYTRWLARQADVRAMAAELDQSAFSLD